MSVEQFFSDSVLLARSTFGTTMAFHIIFATLGVSLPLMILISEIMYQRTKDPDYALMANRWIKGQAILLGVAIPSGTIAGVQLSLLWPGFMEIVGKVVALPFQIEIFAFFLEALFLSIYVYAADRLSPMMRIVSVFFVLLGATASAVLITSVHSFTGTPAGFALQEGEVVNVDPWAAFFNPGFYTNAAHVVASAYMTGAFIIVSIAAYKMLKTDGPQSREYRFHQKALMMGLIVGGIFSLATAWNGHGAAQMLHQYQPEKLAAAEGLFETQDYAPLTIGGITDPDEEAVRFGIEIPWALSFLAGDRFDEVVVGLNEFPKEHWPPLYIHVLFNAMVGIGMLLIFIGFVGFGWKILYRKSPFSRKVKWLFVTTGPLAMIGIEFGWIFSCTGRQPWVIYHTMLTSEAATRTAGLGPLFALFALVYVILGVITALVFKYYFGRKPLKKELMKQTIES
ncbi:cytochrome ubiquinol oxidase subunit I [Caldalkalibacillus salinus]|uniref:cytochrome ubiquinol oxidase subunit I n=1 Tax=Caldalkalibacillus salinus TaxID=2803787 RepID=UPI0019228702|nr:cytochrome ubiquinol oxidase subunit I [Caldalkalibacillus salinus]